jgi:hypothetical protein
MMTKKSEMAEWILDFFRDTKAEAGHMVMLRVIQNKLYDLNPKEKELFYPVVNELIKNDYFTYEEGQLQCFRLTEKGYKYIYDENAVLDCCYDLRKANRKNYLDIINLGFNVASFGIQHNEIEDFIKESCDLFKQVCSIIMDIDDSELLDLIDKHIGLITEVAKKQQGKNNPLDEDTIAKLSAHIYLVSIRLEFLEKKEMLQHLQYLHHLLLGADGR